MNSSPSLALRLLLVVLASACSITIFTARQHTNTTGSASRALSLHSQVSVCDG